MGLGNAISTAVSGLRANGLRVAVAANNVANVTTSGFVPDAVVTSSVVTGNASTTAGGGVTASVQPAILSANALTGQSNVDMAGEFTRLIQAKAAYTQTLGLIRTSEQMLKQRIDETV